jgi:hypothetical protein
LERHFPVALPALVTFYVLNSILTHQPNPMTIFTTLRSKNTGRFAALVLLSLAALSLNSCAKKEEAAPKVSGLSVINASPTLATYNIYLNDAKVNTAALPFLGRISYFQISPGANSIKFTTASSTESQFTNAITLEQDKAYSYFLINKASSLDGLMITDDLNTTNSDKALVRFINLVPDAGSLALAQTGSSELVSAQAYKAYSTFAPVDAKTYSLDLKDPATGSVVKTLGSVVLSAGSVYTIMAAGVLSPSDTEQPVRLQVITNR